MTGVWHCKVYFVLNSNESNLRLSLYHSTTCLRPLNHPWNVRICHRVLSTHCTRCFSPRHGQLKHFMALRNSWKQFLCQGKHLPLFLPCSDFFSFWAAGRSKSCFHLRLFLLQCETMYQTMEFRNQWNGLKRKLCLSLIANLEACFFPFWWDNIIVFT